MTKYDIKIISDNVCPWCYVGKKRLERAISLHQRTHSSGRTDTFTIRWSPFYLDPTAPKISVPRAELYARKFGAARTAAMQARLAQLGRAEGIEFAFGGRTGNTRDSHRLVEFGRAKGGEEGAGRVVAGLFEAYFEREKDITDVGELVAVAAGAGLKEEEAREWLESGSGGDVVDREVKVNSRDTTGVPHFVIQGKYEVGGAQDPNTFLEIFDLVKKAEERGD